jgi:N-acetyl-anhydromuramyl-L-alanine amidase AmpD
VALSGQDDEFVALGDTAWANGIREPGNNWDAARLPDMNPNYLTVSVETEDAYIAGVRPPQPVTGAQYASVLADCQLAMRTYPSIAYLLHHSDISPRSRPNCPGPRWTGSGRFAQLAVALGLRTL